MVITAILVLLIVNTIVNLICTIVGCAGVKRRIRGVKELLQSLGETAGDTFTCAVTGKSKTDEALTEIKSIQKEVADIKELLTVKPKAPAAPKKSSTPAAPKAEKKPASATPKPKKEEKKPMKKEAAPKKAAEKNDKKVRK